MKHSTILMVLRRFALYPLIRAELRWQLLWLNPSQRRVDALVECEGVTVYDLQRNLAI